ncbi:MAG: DUF2225 domain-containing protein [Acholeplasmataceae bacterium]|nr:DUF2225 domain-containing protein [Acholeplasmataceae bacterium]
MTTVMPVEKKCALCGALNECYVLTSTNNFGGIDTEFRSYAVGMDPIAFSLQTCKTCGYTHYDIEKVPKNIAETKEIVKNFLDLKNSDTKPFLIYESYEMAVKILILDEVMPENIAATYLRAAWTAEDSNSALAKKYRIEAARFLSEGISRSEKPSRRKTEQLFLLAEIYRRAGEFKLSEEIHDQIVIEDLHPDLQLALIKIRELLANGDNRKLMLEEVLGR